MVKLRRLPLLEDAPDLARPRTRGECQAGVRPCPWVGCKYHLYLDVLKNGSLTLNFPDLEPEQLRESCALDVADRGGQKLEEVGQYMNLVRERIRQIEMRFVEREDVAAELDPWRGHVAEAVARFSEIEE